MNNFTKRTISSAVFLAVMLTALLTNQYVYGAVMLFILVVMMWEFLKMTCGTEYRYSQILSIIAGATMFIMSYLYKGFGMPGRFIVLSLIPLFILMINSQEGRKITAIEKHRKRFCRQVRLSLCRNRKENIGHTDDYSSEKNLAGDLPAYA